MSQKPRIAFLISGRGSNMLAILEQIRRGKLAAEPVLVFSDKAKAEGLRKAAEFGLETATFAPSAFESFAAYEAAVLHLLQERQVEWVVCAGYMRIIRSTLLQPYANRIVNIHPSLLPSFAGLDAQKQALDYGVKVSGCTVHLVNEAMDAGPILLQSAVPVRAGDTVESLSARILKAEHRSYWRALDRLFRGYRLEGRSIHFKSV